MGTFALMPRGWISRLKKTTWFNCLTVHRHLHCSSNWQIFVWKRLCLAGSAAEIANASFLFMLVAAECACMRMGCRPTVNQHSEQGYRCTVKQPRRKKNTRTLKFAHDLPVAVV